MPTKKMDKAEVNNLLTTAFYAYLATQGNGYPYIIPLCFLYYKGNLYFHSRQSGKKMDQIKANPYVCIHISNIKSLLFSPSPCKFNVAYDSVIVEGKTKIIKDGDMKKKILNLLVQKYSGKREVQPLEPSEIDRVALVEISIDSISGKTNRD